MIAVAGAAALDAPVAEAAVHLTRDPRDPSVVVGRVELGAPPAAVWARLARVAQWQQLFPDIRSLEVKAHQGSAWRVRLDSAIFECGPHDYEVRLGPGQVVDLKILAPGVEAAGQITLSSIGPATTAVYRLRVRAGRIASWFISEANLRRKQERLVEDYLAALARAFGTPARVSRAAEP